VCARAFIVTALFSISLIVVANTLNWGIIEASAQSGNPRALNVQPILNGWLALGSIIISKQARRNDKRFPRRP
jgi:hypothetical protein